MGEQIMKALLFFTIAVLAGAYAPAPTFAAPPEASGQTKSAQEDGQEEKKVAQAADIPEVVVYAERKASGGDVALRSRRPTGASDAHLDLTVGNANEHDVNAYAEHSLIPDKVAARIAIMYRDNDGLIKNTEKGTFVAVPNCPPPPI